MLTGGVSSPENLYLFSFEYTLILKQARIRRLLTAYLEYSKRLKLAIPPFYQKAYMSG